MVFSGENFDLAINHINRLPLRLDTDMTTIKTDTTYMELYDVYNVGKPKIQPLNVTYIGDWSKKNQNGSWLNFFKNSKIMRRRNINGVTIKAVLLIEHNYDREEIEVYLKNDKYPHLDSGCKLSYHLISLIQDIFNYR